jgi:hypothetical protein
MEETEMLRRDDGRYWPASDLWRSPDVRSLSGGQQTRYAQFEFFRS